MSIAVLPFVNMSEDKANEYFSDGLTEELLNVLANVPGLRVIARTSSFAYKGKDAKIADVARDLNVDNVLEGSVRKAGVRVRITTQLIRATDSSHLWSETYDRDVNDIFAVQDEISKEVVDALKVRLLHAETAVQETGGTHVPEAYEAYLQGRFQKNKGEAEDTLKAALAAFEEAIRIDPGYARAYVGKAGTLSTMASNAYLPYDTGFRQSREAAMRAIELAPDLAEGYLSLSFVQAVVDLDLEASKASAERALQLNPGSFDVQQNYAGFQSSLGNHEAAIAAAKKAIELDPLAPQAHTALVVGPAECPPVRQGGGRRAPRGGARGGSPDGPRPARLRAADAAPAGRGARRIRHGERAMATHDGPGPRVRREGRERPRARRDGRDAERRRTSARRLPTSSPRSMPSSAIVTRRFGGSRRRGRSATPD